MNDYVVVKIEKVQHLVSAGDELLVDYLGGKEPKIEVLLKVSNGKLELGTPTLKNPTLKLEVLEEKIKGKKILIQKFKAKSRYRRRMGFRPLYTKVLVKEI